MGMRGLGLLFVVVLVGLAGCKAGEGDSCREQKECRDGLQCFGQEATGARSAWSRKCLSRKNANALCEADVACKEHGRCAAKDGQCVATSDEDCKPTEYCKRIGNLNALFGSLRKLT